MTNILFLCVANAVRSQIAEGLTRAKFGHSVQVQSAGSCPSKVHPLAIKVMREVNVDISAQWSKAVDDIDSTTVDLVVTLCAEEVCPTVLGSARQIHWSLPDPVVSTGSETEHIERFREIRNEINEKLNTLQLNIEKRDNLVSTKTS